MIISIRLSTDNPEILFQVHDEKKFSCDQCVYVSATKATLNHHIKIKHMVSGHLRNPISSSPSVYLSADIFLVSDSLAQIYWALYVVVFFFVMFRTKQCSYLNLNYCSFKRASLSSSFHVCAGPEISLWHVRVFCDRSREPAEASEKRPRPDNCLNVVETNLTRKNKNTIGFQIKKENCQFQQGLIMVL